MRSLIFIHLFLVRLRHQDISHTASAPEHLAPVQPDDNDHGEEHERVPGLGIGPDGVHHLEVIQGGDQKAAAGGIEKGRHKDGHGDDADEIRPKGPGALRRPAHQERRDVPGRPDDAEDQAGPEWREPALQQGRASPRQPNSSIGPRNRASASAGSTLYQGEKGNGSPSVPLKAAPA